MIQWGAAVRVRQCRPTLQTQDVSPLASESSVWTLIIISAQDRRVTTTMADNFQMDEQLKSRFEKVLEHYAGIIKQRNDALIREKTVRDEFEASFRTVVDRVILPATAQVKELVAPKNWICRATKADNGLSAKIEIYQGNMKATTGERPHVKISAAAKVSDVQIYVASQSSGSSQKSVTKVEEVNERLVQGYLLELLEKLIAEGPPR